MRLASARAARVTIREGRNKWQADQTQDVLQRLLLRQPLFLR
jgi:hypothetical protein